MNVYSLIPLAMGPAPGGTGQNEQSPLFMFVWLGLMLVIFYFLLIRPQQRREKERRALMDAIKTGDRVLFSGGILGIVVNVKEKTVIVKVADNVKLEVLRGAVQQVLDKGEEPAEAPKA
jgi:preprotein translocase subunit YajC